MRIQIASDLHLEHLAETHPKHRIVAHTDADILVLAGDIQAGTQMIEDFVDWPVPIIYVHGNHELYGRDLQEVQDELHRKASAHHGSRVHFLENGKLELGDVRFLGACLWTDYALYGNADSAMAIARSSLNDHYRIRHAAAGGGFCPEHALEIHQTSRAWLEQKLAEPFNGRTVIVTHHCPHPSSIHAKYADDPLNAAFASDLTPLVEKADVWIHGHTHSSFDYSVGKCRVVCNPCGYPLNRHVAEPIYLEFENGEFSPSLVIEV